jgi:hypothetical protein
MLISLNYFRNLETLTVGKGQLGDPFFGALGDCIMLKSLNVNDATLGSGIQEIPINHDRLCHLQLTKCRVMRISVRWNTIKLLNQNSVSLLKLCAKMHLLQVSTTWDFVFEAQQHGTGCAELSSPASPWHRLLPQAYRCSNSFGSNFMPSISIFRHVELFLCEWWDTTWNIPHLC